MQQLKKLGWDEEWLLNIKENFHPKKQGKYEIKIYSLDDLDQDPEDGIWIDTTCFDTDLELSIVLFFFEGLGYVMKDVQKDEVIGQGILDQSPFEECDDHEGKPWGTWNWYSADELGPWFKKQREEELKKLTDGHARVHKRKIYVVMTQGKVDYDFSVTTLKHGAFNKFKNAVERLKKEIEAFKIKHAADYKRYSNADEYEDEDNGAWTEYQDFEKGYWCVTFGYDKWYESHQITIEEFEMED